MTNETTNNHYRATGFALGGLGAIIESFDQLIALGLHDAVLRSLITLRDEVEDIADGGSIF